MKEDTDDHDDPFWIKMLKDEDACFGAAIILVVMVIVAVIHGLLSA